MKVAWTGCRLLALQYRKFCLFTWPKRWKCASSLKKPISSGWRLSKMFLRSPKQLCLSCSESFWALTILYGWKWRSMCKIRQALQTNIWRAAACLRAKHYGNSKILFLNVLMCFGVRGTTRPSTAFHTTEPVRLKFATHNTDLRSGTDVWGGIWNWVRNACWATTTESLGMITSTAIACAFDHAFSATANGRGAEWGQLGKKLPPPFLWVHYSTATDLSFTSFSLHTYENWEVVLPHPVLFNCECLHCIVTEQFSYFEKIKAIDL